MHRKRYSPLNIFDLNFIARCYFSYLGFSCLGHKFNTIQATDLKRHSWIDLIGHKSITLHFIILVLLPFIFQTVFFFGPECNFN